MARWRSRLARGGVRTVVSAAWVRSWHVASTAAPCVVALRCRKTHRKLVDVAARALQALVGRYDRAAFEPQGGDVRVRLAVAGGDAWDALLRRGAARLARAGGDPDATLTADARTWAAIADDAHGGMRAFRSGRLAVVATSTSALGSWRRRPASAGRGACAFERSSRVARVCPSLRRASARPFSPSMGWAAPRGRFCSRPRRWLTAFASSPLTFRDSATLTSRSARLTTPPSSPTR